MKCKKKKKQYHSMSFNDHKNNNLLAFPFTAQTKKKPFYHQFLYLCNHGFLVIIKSKEK
jgi:hypothetical protein